MYKIVFKDPSLNTDFYLPKIEDQKTWSVCPSFKSKGRYICYHGTSVKHGNYAPRFQIIEKRQRYLSIKERIARIIKAIILIIKYPKASLHDKKLYKLISKNRISIHFAKSVSTDPFIKDKLLSQKKQRALSEDSFKKRLHINEAISQTLLDKFPLILSKTNSPEVKFFLSQPSHLIFTLSSFEHLIFKINMDPHSSHPIKDRYEKMLEAETLVREFKYRHLKVPAAHLINIVYKGQHFDVLIEEKLSFNDTLSFQKRAFSNSDANTSCALLELAQFICKSGYSDVEYRNNPILDESTPCRIGLIDLEHLESTPWGLFGMQKQTHGISRKGLIGLCSSSLQDKIYAIAKDHGLFGDVGHITSFGYQNPGNIIAFNEACRQRHQEIEDNKKLCEFYERSKITSCNQPIKYHLNLNHEFILQFAPFYNSQQQELFAKGLYGIIIDFLKNTDKSLPLDLARLVSLDLTTSSIEFKLFCTAYLTKLKAEGCIFDFKEDETAPHHILVQC